MSIVKTIHRQWQLKIKQEQMLQNKMLSLYNKDT